MANDFSKGYAQKYAGELDKMIVQSAKTGFFADNAFKAKFIGARTVQIPELTLVGLGDYDRVTGFKPGDATLVYKDYTLSQERSRQLYLDAQDADESGVGDLAGKFAGEFTRTQVVPEIDAFSLSKLYGVASEAENLITYAKTTGVANLLEAIASVEAAMEYDGGVGTVAFVDPEMYGVLMNSTELNRSITISDFKQGEINTKVKTINGCAIIPVAASRMRGKYVYADGNDSSKGGFSPEDGSANVRAIVLPKDSASLVKKVDKLDIHAPGADVMRDGYVINYRLYYDLFVKNSRKGTIFAIA